MTSRELRAFATNVVEGGPVKKSEVLAFMKAFLTPDQAAAAPDLSTLGGRRLPELPFQIEKTETGIHVPREANRYYTRIEAAALLAALAKALE